MRSRVDGLIRLVVVHLAVACASSVIGAATGKAVPAEPRTPGLLWEEAGRIYANNVRALVVLVATGVALAGLAGIVVFAVNGYMFGQMLVASDVALTWLWLFAPVELISFAIGAAAAMRVGMDLVRWTGGGAALEPAELERLGIAVGMAGAGLAVAAVLEAWAIRWAWAS